MTDKAEQDERRARTERVLAYLNHEKRRCTYEALGDFLGDIPAQSVGQYLGEKRPEASWVVSKKTGRPTGYTPDQFAEGLQKDPHDPIECSEDLWQSVLKFENAERQTVRAFLDFPAIGEDGRIDRVYPAANFSKLIAQVRRCESGYLRLVGVIMVVEALITRIKEAGLGVEAGMKDPLTKKEVPGSTGEMAPFNDHLQRFRHDRNLIVHNFLWRNTDGVSEEILKRSDDLMNALLEHFIKVPPDSDAPGVMTLRFPEIWNLDTHPPGRGR